MSISNESARIEKNDFTGVSSNPLILKVTSKIQTFRIIIDQNPGDGFHFFLIKSTKDDTNIITVFKAHHISNKLSSMEILLNESGFIKGKNKINIKRVR